LQPGTFTPAFAGTEAVIHTASPYIVWVPKGQARAAVVEPAVKGKRIIARRIVGVLLAQILCGV
jgi:hypothetical protein